MVLFYLEAVDNYMYKEKFKRLKSYKEFDF